MSPLGSLTQFSFLPFGYYLVRRAHGPSYRGRMDYPDGIGDNRLHFSLFSQASHISWGASFSCQIIDSNQHKLFVSSYVGRIDLQGLIKQNLIRDDKRQVYRKGRRLTVINNDPTAFPNLPNVDANRDRTPHDVTRVLRGKVLIVDDEIDVVNTLQSYLSEKGYKNLSCTSGKGAIEALKKYDFDLLLTDLAMPEMTGIQLLQAALEIDPCLIGIIITGKGTIESAVAAMKAEAFDYLLKPFDFEVLSPILNRAMQVRELKKSEERHRNLVDELTLELRKCRNDSDKFSTKELEIFELKEEIGALKEALRTHKETYKNYLFNGGSFDE
jgi:DNA-binding response OmpR family regulator